MRHRLREQFVDAGFEPRDADARSSLILDAAAAFSEVSGREPRWSWFVPGRIEIFGKHTDYAGGRSLVCAVPRGFGVVAGPRDDGLVCVIDARLGEIVTVDPAGDWTGDADWAKYVSVVARRLSVDFPGAELGSNIALASDLPRAAGLSSSSALVVALALVLIERAALRERPEWEDELETAQDLAGYLGAVENGLPFRSFEYGTGVGTLGGSEDHTAILLSAAESVAAYAYLPVSREGAAELPRDWRFVVMPSGIQADKAGNARERYNRASRAARTLCELWRWHFGPEHDYIHLAEALDENPEAIPEFTAALLTEERDGFTGLELVKRLLHFMAEDARVPAALDAFERGDREELSGLAAASQHDAQTLLANQILETSELVRLARSSGAFAATSFGAGFGGSVWALVDAAGAAEFAARWKAEYVARFASHKSVSSFVCRPTHAAMRIDVGQS